MKHLKSEIAVKKITAFLTALLMVASVFTSCKEDKKEDDTQTTTATTTDSETETEQGNNVTFKPYEEVRVSTELPNYSQET